MPQTAVYSTVCAIQNLWLAARAEGVGVGWVSILDFGRLRKLLEIPEDLVPVAYLCVGYVSEFPPRPDLEASGWESRESIARLIFDFAASQGFPVVEVKLWETESSYATYAADRSG